MPEKTPTPAAETPDTTVEGAKKKDSDTVGKGQKETKGAIDNVLNDGNTGVVDQKPDTPPVPKPREETPPLRVLPTLKNSAIVGGAGAIALMPATTATAAAGYGAWRLAEKIPLVGPLLTGTRKVIGSGISHGLHALGTGVHAVADVAATPFRAGYRLGAGALNLAGKVLTPITYPLGVLYRNTGHIAQEVWNKSTDAIAWTAQTMKEIFMLIPAAIAKGWEKKPISTVIAVGLGALLLSGTATSIIAGSGSIAGGISDLVTWLWKLIYAGGTT